MGDILHVFVAYYQFKGLRSHLLRVENNVLEKLRAPLKEVTTSGIKGFLVESEGELLKIFRSETKKVKTMRTIKYLQVNSGTFIPVQDPLEVLTPKTKTRAQVVIWSQKFQTTPPTNLKMHKYDHWVDLSQRNVRRQPVHFLL